MKHLLHSCDTLHRAAAGGGEVEDEPIKHSKISDNDSTMLLQGSCVDMERRGRMIFAERGMALSASLAAFRQGTSLSFV